MPEPDDYARYEAWSAMNQPEPKKWVCEYCRRRGEGEPPYLSEAQFSACCEAHAKCLDYMDVCEQNYMANWRDTIVAVGILILMLMIALAGDLR